MGIGGFLVEILNLRTMRRAPNLGVLWENGWHRPDVDAEVILGEKFERGALERERLKKRSLKRDLQKGILKKKRFTRFSGKMLRFGERWLGC